MSKALDYLLQARPQAMQQYFGFLKEAGRRLDPKTRAIISVITKVDNQTASGFRQYLKRALKEGVTADEVLDALLFAFPTLGLTKITWAMDILLEMDLPEFRLENLGLQPQWHDVTGIAALGNGVANALQVHDKTIYVYSENGVIHVYDSCCPHRATVIGAERLDGCRLTCPGHQWQFDLRNGECVAIGNLPLTQLEHKVVAGRLLVYW